MTGTCLGLKMGPGTLPSWRAAEEPDLDTSRVWDRDDWKGKGGGVSF